MTTDERLPWFPCDPSKLLGALSAMNSDQKLVYVIVLLRIYETAGPCVDPLEAIVQRTGLNRRRVSEALNFLFKTGKLERQGDGMMNKMAERVLADRMAIRQDRKIAGARGGKATRKKTIENQSEDGLFASAKPEANGSDLQLQLQSEGKEEVVRAKPRGPHKLPLDWEPGQSGWHYAAINGFEGQEAKDLFAGFRGHYKARGSKWEIWSLVWEKWVRNEVGFKKNKMRNGQGQPRRQSLADIARGEPH